MFRALFLLALVLSLRVSWAQADTAYSKPAKEPFNLHERIWYGGGIGLTFGSVTAVQLDPLVGLTFGDQRKLAVGVGPSYFYYEDRRFDPSFSYSGFGYRVVTRYKVIERAFAHAEFYHLNAECFNPVLLDPVRRWIPHVLVGGGYREPIGDYSSFYLQVLWEVMNDPCSVYRGLGPIISGGIGIGF
jgi:hypothetical protein